MMIKLQQLHRVALLFALSPVLSPAIAWSMQTLDDQTLADTVAQDGVTVTIGTAASNSGRIGFDRLSLQDSDGFGTMTGPASIGYFANTSGGGGVAFYSGAAGTTAIANPIKIIMDADGNSTANAVFNASLVFENLTRINLPAFAIALTADSAVHKTNPGNHNIIANSRRDIIKIGGTGLDIKFGSGGDLRFNVQLGDQPQGHMIKFTGGSITQIRNDPLSPIEVVSTNSSGNSSLKLNFDLSSTNATGISMVGFYGDIVNSGLVLGKDGTTDKFNLTLSNVVAGTTGSQSATSFNNLKNASIGTIGLVGASVTNLKMTVKGL